MLLTSKELHRAPLTTSEKDAKETAGYIVGTIDNQWTF